MDRLMQAYYEEKLKNIFHERGGDAFQDFFSEVMEKSHPGDFQRVRPWGNVGDKKNDGYLRSRRMLFQVYAPSAMRSDKAVTKIEEDYHGAIEYWQEFFDFWIFVHNSRDGLGPHITRKLLELNAYHASVTVIPWGFEELRHKVFALSEVNLASLLGPAPSQGDMLNLRFDDLRDVLLTVAGQEPPSDLDIRPVPHDKLLYNGLSANTKIMLNAGMQKADLVGQFFDRWPAPTFGDKIAQTFMQQYKTYQGVGMAPDLIFHKLQLLAGGSQREEVGHEDAVLAVLAYFFEHCDIFERPPEDVSS